MNSMVYCLTRYE